MLFIIFNLILLMSCGVGYMEYAANHNKASVGNGSSGGSGGSNGNGVKPTCQTTSIVGEAKTLTLTFDIALDEVEPPINTSFMVIAGGEANPVTKILISGTTATLTLTNYNGSNETVSISYNGNFLKSATGSEVENFSINPVTNNSLYHLCGQSQDSCYCSTTHPPVSNDGCYNDFTQGENKFAITRTGKILKYVDSGFGNNFYIWIEANPSDPTQAKVLAGTGLDAWQEKLVANGRRHNTGNYFTVNTSSSNVITGTSVYLKGRSCPPQVFYDADESGSGAADEASDFTNTNMCLYYADISGDHSMDENTTTSGTTGITSWDNVAGNTGGGINGSWYETNHIQCGNLGMRLPVLYETSLPSCPLWDGGNWPACQQVNLYQYPTVPALTGIILSGATNEGVPSNSSGWSWVASASRNSSDNFWLWNGNNAFYSRSNDDSDIYLVCVIP